MDKKTREEVKREISEKADRDNRNDVTIYNVPDNVWSDFVSAAKLHYDNEGWKVLKEGLASLMEDKTSRVDELEARIERLEEKLGKLALVVQNLKDGAETEDDEIGDPPTTMGG